MASDIAKLIKQAKDEGWRIETRGSGHYRATSPEEKIVTFAKTPSDHRAAANIREDFRKAGLIEAHHAESQIRGMLSQIRDTVKDGMLPNEFTTNDLARHIFGISRSQLSGGTLSMFKKAMLLAEKEHLFHSTGQRNSQHYDILKKGRAPVAELQPITPKPGYYREIIEAAQKEPVILTYDKPPSKSTTLDDVIANLRELHSSAKSEMTEALQAVETARQNHHEKQKTYDALDRALRALDTTMGNVDVKEAIERQELLTGVLPANPEQFVTAYAAVVEAMKELQKAPLAKIQVVACRKLRKSEDHGSYANRKITKDGIRGSLYRARTAGLVEHLGGGVWKWKVTTSPVVDKPHVTARAERNIGGVSINQATLGAITELREAHVNQIHAKACQFGGRDIKKQSVHAALSLLKTQGVIERISEGMWKLTGDNHG